MELTEDVKKNIWDKGIKDDRFPSDRVRKDACGAFMLYEDFGDRSSIFGWEIDHIYPAAVLKDMNVAEDKIDALINLRPMNWKNNASKGTNYPFYTTSLVADDDKATNVEMNVGKVVNHKVQKELSQFFNLESKSDGGEL